MYTVIYINIQARLRVKDIIERYVWTRRDVLTIIKKKFESVFQVVLLSINIFLKNKVDNIVVMKNHPSFEISICFASCISV